MNKARKRILLATSGICCAITAISGAACGEENLPKADFVVGASTSLVESAGDGVSLVFNASVDKAYYDGLVEKYGAVEAGLLLVPAADVPADTVPTAENASVLTAENFQAVGESYHYTGAVEGLTEETYGETYCARGYLKIDNENAKDVADAVLYEGAYYVYSDFTIENCSESVYSSAYDSVALQGQTGGVAAQCLSASVTIEGALARKAEVVPVYNDYTPYELVKNVDGSVTAYTNVGQAKVAYFGETAYRYNFMTSGYNVNVYSGRGVSFAPSGEATLKGGKNDYTERSCFAYFGEFGEGYYVDFTFTGDNLPEVKFFADGIDQTDEGYLFDGSEMRTKISDNKATYQYVVGTKDVSGTLYADAYLYQYSNERQEYVLVHQTSVSTEILTEEAEDKSIVVYAKSGVADTKFTFSDPHGYVPVYGNQELLTFGYSTNAGNSWIQEKEGADLYQDYVDAGLNVYYLSGDAGFGYEDNKTNWRIPTETWTEYMAKGYYEKAAAKSDRILITDYYFYRMIEAYYDGREDGSKLIGDGALDMFPTQAAFEKAVKDRLATYYQAKNFFGVTLRDEPEYKHFNTYGLVYRAIKKAAAELGMEYIYIHCNLLPMTVPDKAERLDPSYAQTNDVGDTFTKYVTNFINATGCDRLSVDEYPYRTTGFRVGYYSGLQLLTEICRAKNIKITYVMQACGSLVDNPYSAMTLGDMYMQVYSSLGFGIKQLGVYTFSQGTANQNDTACMINNKGEKNDSYHYVQKAFTEALKMEDVLLSYEYQGARIYSQTFSYNREYLDSGIAGYPGFSNTYQFKRLEKVRVDDDLALITEMKDEANGLYMYMVQNIIAEHYIKSGAEDGTVKVSLDFGDTTSIAVYENGSVRYMTIEDGKFEKTLLNGRAIFIIPLN